LTPNALLTTFCRKGVVASLNGIAQFDYNCRVPHLAQDSPVDYADRIASLVERRLPLPVESAGDEDDWSLVGPALLAAATRHLRTLGHLQAEFPSGVVAWQLLRTMFEYVTAFAWIAADPELRIRRWLKYDYGQRVKVDSDLRSLGDDPILDAATRGRLIAYEPDLDSMPGFVEVAREADEAWAATLEQIDSHVPEDLRRFRLQYVWIYRNGRERSDGRGSRRQTGRSSSRRRQARMPSRRSSDLAERSRASPSSAAPSRFPCLRDGALRVVSYRALPRATPVVPP